VKKLAGLSLLVIILVTIFLRVYQLNTVPPELFGDEIDVGYQSYSILKTGKDLHNRFLPFYIRSLSEYRTPLYIYSTVPFIAIFGLNEWGVRLPAAFWGVISIIGLFLLTRKLFNTKTALLSALLLAISPWHLQYSRASFEVTMLLAFEVFAVYFFILATKRPYYLILSLILFGLTPYIYSTAVVFTPLIFIWLLFVYRKDFLKKEFLNKSKLPIALSLLVIILCILPIIWGTYTGEAKGRFQVISIFQDSVLVDKLNISRKGQDYYDLDGNKHHEDSQFERLFHNKPLIFGQIFGQNYLTAFSFDFLFSNGDPNFRQAVFEMGELYIIELISILLGLFYLFKKSNSESKLVVLGWLLIAPIPAALTFGGGYHATRLFLMLIPLTMINSLGVYFILKLPRKLLALKVLFFIALFISLGLYLHRYYSHYPLESWRWWQTGFKDEMLFIKENQNRYSKIVINNSYEPSLIRYLFYTQYDPSKFQQEFSSDETKKEVLPFINGFKLNDQVYFGQLDDSTKDSGGFEKAFQPGMLYVASARDEAKTDLRYSKNDHFKVIKTIFNPLGQPIFYFLEWSP
jgi:4-amino-4-deoxy-L-arabinose transferase-like glycosyltransferase